MGADEVSIVAGEIGSAIFPGLVVDLNGTEEQKPRSRGRHARSPALPPVVPDRLRPRSITNEVRYPVIPALRQDQMRPQPPAYRRADLRGSTDSPQMP